MHKLNDEMWIHFRAVMNRGWLPLPRHAEGGRHAGRVSRMFGLRKRTGSHGVRYARMGA